MTEQSKQLVTGIYEAFGSGDLETVLNGLANDVNWNLPGVAPYAGVRQGRGAVREFFMELIMAGKIEMFEVDAVIAEGARVVVLGRERCTAVKTTNCCSRRGQGRVCLHGLREFRSAGLVTSLVGGRFICGGKTV